MSSPYLAVYRFTMSGYSKLSTSDLPFCNQSWRWQDFHKDQWGVCFGKTWGRLAQLATSGLNSLTSHSSLPYFSPITDRLEGSEKKYHCKYAILHCIMNVSKLNCYTFSNFVKNIVYHYPQSLYPTHKYSAAKFRHTVRKTQPVRSDITSLHIL